MSQGDKIMAAYSWSIQNVRQLYEDKISLRSSPFSEEISSSWSKWRLLLTTTFESDASEQVSKEIETQHIALHLRNINFASNSLYKPIVTVSLSFMKPTEGMICWKTRMLIKLTQGQDVEFSDYISVRVLEKLKIQELIVHCKIQEVEKDLQCYKSLLNNTMFSDVQLLVQGEIYPAHKVVLAASSLVFREKCSNPEPISFIKVEDIQPKVFYELLRYMYSGNVQNAEEMDFEFFEAVCKYEVWKFIAKYMKNLAAGLKVAKFVPTFMLCYNHFNELHFFLDECFKFLIRNFRAVIKLGGWEDLLIENSQNFQSLLFIVVKYLETLECKKIENDALILSNVVGYCPKEYEIFLNNSTFSDIEIEVQGKKFNAHKIVLAARSPVFSRMFAHNMTETISGSVKIEDLKPKTFYELLRFMYTNKFDRMDRNLMRMIFIAADKYEIEELKLECGDILGKTITRKNFRSTLILADDYNAEGLKRMCIFFIIDHVCFGFFDKVSENFENDFSAFFECFQKSHRNLYLDILRQMVSDYELHFDKILCN